VTVPDYQTLMAPALRALNDGTEYSVSKLQRILVAQLKLTDDDLKVTIPSGAPLFANRLQWALSYLYQTRLIRRPRRGVVQITDRGRDILAKYPGRIDVGVLSQFKEFTDFRRRTR
jgi:restriction system protein